MTAPRPARIAHVALWTDDIDRLVRFYVSHFGAAAGERYVNAAKGFESRFLSFGEGARLEVMRSSTKDIAPRAPGVETMGLAHLAVAVGSERAVDALTDRLRRDGAQVVDGPRRTGDGCYESVVLDPDGNRVELTASD